MDLYLCLGDRDLRDFGDRDLRDFGDRDRRRLGGGLSRFFRGDRLLLRRFFRGDRILLRLRLRVLRLRRGGLRRLEPDRLLDLDLDLGLVDGARFRFRSSSSEELRLISDGVFPLLLVLEEVLGDAIRTSF